MSKIPFETTKKDIPTLTELVSSKERANPKTEVAAKRSQPAVAHPLDAPAMDLNKLEKLIHQKLQQRFKLLSKELASEIIAELDNGKND